MDKVQLLKIRTVIFLLLSIAFSGVVRALPPGDSWNDATAESAHDSINRRGSNPIYINAPWNPNLGTAGGRLEDDGGSLSGNYSLNIPIANYPGRGLDLKLNLYYNSQLWTSYGNSSGANGQLPLGYNLDGDWPSPGWSIGFGKISSSILIGPDHTRYSLIGRTPDPNSQSRISGVSGDSLRTVVKCCTTNKLANAVLRNGDGSSVEYFSPSPDYGKSDYYPSRVIDRNGNFISISYRRDASGRQSPPAIDTIVDTVGRVVKFHYDAKLRLVAITGPDLDAGRRTLARFFFTEHHVNVGVGPNCLPYTKASVFDGIYFVSLPGNDTGYLLRPWTSYGMSTEVMETRGVKLDARSLTEQGTLISQGPTTRNTVFSYPDINISCIKEPPAYTKRTEDWFDPIKGVMLRSVTTFQKSETDTDTVITVTRPDRSLSKQFLALKTDAAKYLVAGQIRRVELADESGRVLQSTDFEWEKNAPNSYGAARQRSIVQNIDPLSRGKRIEFGYDSNFPSLVTAKYYYGYSDASNPSTIGWYTETVYNRQSNYLAAQILNLPKTILKHVGSPSGSHKVDFRTDFDYDQTDLSPVGTIAGHLIGFEPHTVRRCIKYETDSSTGRPKRRCVKFGVFNAKIATDRGNVTTVTKYADASTPGQPIISKLSYDTTGNVIVARDAEDSGTINEYERASNFSLLKSTTIGAVEATSPRVKTSYTYYAGSGLPKAKPILTGE